MGVTAAGGDGARWVVTEGSVETGFTGAGFAAGGGVLTVVVTVRLLVAGALPVAGFKPAGASDSSSRAGSEVNPIGCDTSVLARYVTAAASTRPASAIAMIPLRWDQRTEPSVSPGSVVACE